MAAAGRIVYPPHDGPLSDIPPARPWSTGSSLPVLPVSVFCWGNMMPLITVGQTFNVNRGVSSDRWVARKINVELVDTVSLVFKYNRTFGEVSSNETIRAWEELFPEQGGFFRHPTIAPKRSAFSVFHQLHCLVSIPVDPK